MAKKIYQLFANTVVAYHNCVLSKNTKWQEHHAEFLQSLIQEYLPHGSGFDTETKIDIQKSGQSKLVFNSQFHVMNENGFYVGWLPFTVKVKASLLMQFTVDVTGPFSRFGKPAYNLKDYIAECYCDALEQEVEYGAGWTDKQ